jgi:hypothetical protein
MSFTELGGRQQIPVEEDEGRKMKERTDAYGFVETSAKNNDGVYRVFQMATEVKRLRL